MNTPYYSTQQLKEHHIWIAKELGLRVVQYNFKKLAPPYIVEKATIMLDDTQFVTYEEFDKRDVNFNPFPLMNNVLHDVINHISSYPRFHCSDFPTLQNRYSLSDVLRTLIQVKHKEDTEYVINPKERIKWI
jgi:hypothetical protein